MKTRTFGGLPENVDVEVIPRSMASNARCVEARTQRIRWSKRVLDLLLSGIGLLVSALLWLIIAGAIKLEDGRPVFYAHERIGEGGRRFRSWKFRSMVQDSDQRYGPMQAKDGDDRATRVGKVLRATALDELPQLWNIFKGDMSFVGPRALLPEEIEVNGNGELIPLGIIPGYEKRHRVRPGLTGLAQIYAPRDILRETSLSTTFFTSRSKTSGST